jgi:hypothetical protein
LDRRGGVDIVQDEASGAYLCFALDDDAKKNNGQNYAWFAGVSFSVLGNQISNLDFFSRTPTGQKNAQNFSKILRRVKDRWEKIKQRQWRADPIHRNVQALLNFSKKKLTISSGSFATTRTGRTNL